MARLLYGDAHNADVRYVLQYAISDPVFVLEVAGQWYVFLSVLDIDAFTTAGNQAVEAVPVGSLSEAARARTDVRSGLAALAAVILEHYGVGTEITVGSNFPVAIADGLRTVGISVVVSEVLLPERARKSPQEISALRENATHTAKAFVLIEHVLEASTIDGDRLIYKGEVLTSEFLKREIGTLFLQFDLHNTAGIIVSCGAAAAAPHASGHGPLQPHQTIVADIFPQSSQNHYWADMTRTYVKGRPTDTMQKMYDAVLEAQRASLAALTPGMSARSLYDVSAETIRHAGFEVGERGYTHSLGHGIGVAVHETPTVGPRSDMILEPGMVITIEPGLYYPEHGGVRIEDMVLVTDSGYELLSEHPNYFHIV